MKYIWMRIKKTIESIKQALLGRNGVWIYYCYQNYMCSECEYIVADDDVEEYKYCPNCGAKMESEEQAQGVEEGR